MARRVSLPTADDLFGIGGPIGVARPQAVRAVPDHVEKKPTPKRRTSGRVRHDEKVTVYLTASELIAVEQARLSLRGQYGVAVDRGRLIREAVAIVLADFEERGPNSVLVQRMLEE